MDDFTEEIKDLIEDYSGSQNDIYELEKEKSVIECTLKIAKENKEHAKNEILKLMQENGVVKEPIEYDNYILTVSVPKPKQMVDCDDIENIPDEFIRIKKEIDKTAISDYLKDGNQPNWASLKDAKISPKITIRMK